MPDHLINADVAEDPNKRARALLLRVSVAALERADLLLENTSNMSYAPDSAAARLLEAAAKGVEIAIGPIDPPDVVVGLNTANFDDPAYRSE